MRFIPVLSIAALTLINTSVFGAQDGTGGNTDAAVPDPQLEIAVDEDGNATIYIGGLVAATATGLELTSEFQQSLQAILRAGGPGEAISMKDALPACLEDPQHPRCVDWRIRVVDWPPRPWPNPPPWPPDPCPQCGSIQLLPPGHPAAGGAVDPPRPADLTGATLWSFQNMEDTLGVPAR